MAPQDARLVAVDYSPDGHHAVVLLEDDEPFGVEAYVLLCQYTPSDRSLGWRADTPRFRVTRRS